MHTIRFGDTDLPPEIHHVEHHMGVFREVAGMDELDDMVEHAHHEISDLDGCETHMHFITADVSRNTH
ncbi:MAG: hypothetical protein ABH871_07990 [Pseudomonadota bacterium]